LASLILSAT